MTVAELQEQLDGLAEQQKQAEVNFHQVTGAVAITQQLLEKAKEQESKAKDSEEKNRRTLRYYEGPQYFDCVCHIYSSHSARIVSESTTRDTRRVTVNPVTIPAIIFKSSVLFKREKK